MWISSNLEVYQKSIPMRKSIALTKAESSFLRSSFNSTADKIFKELVLETFCGSYLPVYLFVSNQVLRRSVGVQTFHHLTFIHPTVNHGHLITRRLIT